MAFASNPCCHFVVEGSCSASIHQTPPSFTPVIKATGSQLLLRIIFLISDLTSSDVCVYTHTVCARVCVDLMYIQKGYSVLVLTSSGSFFFIIHNA